MTPNICHTAAMLSKGVPFKKDTDGDRKSVSSRRMVILLIVLTFIISVALDVRADPYEVLVVDIAEAGDLLRIEEFKKDAGEFNSLHQRGYSKARPYFNVLHLANGQVYFVFGFRNKVQGIHRRNYPGTEENLRRMKQKGVQKYPHMHWLPVQEIRRFLAAP